MEKKVLVFGATGGTGQQIIRASLSQGHKVTAFVRDPDRLENHHGNLHVFKGDVLNAIDVRSAVSGQDVIISALGSKPFTTPVCADGIRNIISAMKNPQKLIVESAYGAGDSKKGIYARILCCMLKEVMDDKNKMEEHILQSHLETVIIRPTILTKGSKTGRYRIGDVNIKGFPKISRADVADFMTRCISDNTYANSWQTITY